MADWDNSNWDTNLLSMKIVEKQTVPGVVGKPYPRQSETQNNSSSWEHCQVLQFLKSDDEREVEHYLEKEVVALLLAG